MRWPFVLVVLLCVTSIFAQEENAEYYFLDWDIDSVFDEPAQTEPVKSDPVKKDDAIPASPPGQDTVKKLIQQRGYTFTASSEFVTGVAPGWHRIPGDSDWDTSEYFLNRYLKMTGAMSIDAQISDVFRTKSVIQYEIPDFKFTLGDFFFDYKLYDVVFFRGGKYSASWGISPNYGFTNLLSRVPKYGNANEPFTFKADAPIGNGGLQVLALTRVNLMSSNYELPAIKDFGFGGKYNLALPWADFDAGLFYQEGMALRGFLSIKTTLWNTELYNEWLGAIDVDEPSNMSGAFNIGFERQLFDKKLNINGELFFNAEKDAMFYHPETKIREAGTSPFIEGFNMALNLRYRLWENGNPRLFLSALYAPAQNSAQLIPGFRYSPWQHIEFYFAAPLALGDRDGYYRKHTITETNNKNEDKENKPLPFAIIFLITLKGSVRFGHYY